MADQSKDARKPPAQIGTTGHEWDGIQELNTPLPRWWLWLFYATIVWSVGYWIVYPAWPLVFSYSNGVFNWHTRSAVATDLAELQQQRGPMIARLSAASLQEIEVDAGAAGLRPRARSQRLCRQLRTLPRHRRRRRQGLPEPCRQ